METVAYQSLMNDLVRDIIPKFYREVEYNGDCILQIVGDHRLVLQQYWGVAL